MKAFRADWVCPVASPPLADGTLVVDGDRIEAVVALAGEAPSGIPVESFPGCVIIPGFINVHTHLELTVLRGLLEGLTFIDWIRTLTRTRNEEMTEADLVVSARLGALECLAAGVTALGEVMAAGVGWDAMVETGLRGIAYQEVFGPSPDAADRSAAELRETLTRLGQTGIEPARRLGVSPHAPYSVSAQLYERVRDLAAAEGLPLALHIAESNDEGRFVREGGGPFADFLRSRGIAVRGHGVGPLSWVDGLGLLGSGTLAIHAIEASDAEIDRLRRTDTAVAHCPKSNSKFGHPIARLREFIDAGVRVGLGSDSVASNNTVDMFEEMRTAILMQRTRLQDPGALTAEAVLRMATLGGARCLGLDSEIGSLEAGKLADFVVVDLDEAATQPVYDPVEALVWTASRRNVRATYLGGALVRLDPEPWIRKARAIADRLRPQTPLNK